MRDDSGQSLLEFVICFPLLLAAVAASVFLFRTEWNRIQCNRSAFRTAHWSLRHSNGGLPATIDAGNIVRIQSTENGVITHAYCGKASETVSLPLLEKAQW